MSDVDHCYSEQGVPTDSGKVCSGVNCHRDERMYICNNGSISEKISHYLYNYIYLYKRKDKITKEIYLYNRSFAKV